VVPGRAGRRAPGVEPVSRSGENARRASSGPRS
jgi:hypothetical protein